MKMNDNLARSEILSKPRIPVACRSAAAGHTFFAFGCYVWYREDHTYASRAARKGVKKGFGYSTVVDKFSCWKKERHKVETYL